MRSARAFAWESLTATVILGAALFPQSVRAQGSPSSTVIAPLRAAAWPAVMPPRSISPMARPVTIDFGALAGANLGDQVVFDLDAGRLAVVVDQIERRSSISWSLVGRAASDLDGFVLLCVEGDALAGLIQAPSLGQLYRIGFVADGIHELAPVEPISVPDCATVGESSTAPAQSPELLPRPPVAGGSCPAPLPNGDVMIYYSPSARMEAGGVNAMNAQCQLAVDVANQTYVASVITNQLALIFRGEIAYTEAGDLEIDRNRLKATSDGFMDQVHGDRNYFGADFVTLFARNSDANACGIAYCTPSGPAEGFCVVDWTCASGNFSFAHEIGHLQGCAHNHEDAGSGCNENCYSFGHRFFGNSGTGWRTVMSYNNDDGDFTRIGRWSNPDVLFDGQPCGIWTGDCDDDNRFNAATVSNTAPNREGWRDPRFDVWVDLFASAPWRGTYDRPFPDVQAGANAIFDGGDTPALPVLHIKAQSYPGTFALSKRMAIVACGGLARIGG